MKKLVVVLILAALLVGSASVGWAKPTPGDLAGAVPKDRGPMPGIPAPGAGVEDIGGSTVNYVSPNDLPVGIPFDLCLHVTEMTPDWNEYLDGFDAQLPTNWTVNYVIDTPHTACFNGHTYGVTDNKVWWYTNGMPSGCGDWAPGTYGFCANVTIPDCGGSPWGIAWNIWGDTYGGNPPHSVSGAVYTDCQQPGVYLIPSTQPGSACVGQSIDYTFKLFNYTGADGSFAVSVDDTWGMACPASVFAEAGATLPFACTLRVPCAGGSDTATVTATGNGYSDTATAASSSLSGWAAEPSSPVAVFDNAAVSYNGKLYVLGGLRGWGAVQIWDGSTWTQGTSSGLRGEEGDACLGLDADGHPVIDLLGDAWFYANIRRYDISADSWSELPYPPGYPAEGLWAYDVVSMLEHSGQNVCYISGGGTAAGGGDTSALYAYYPDTQTVVNLGDYTLHPDGFDFHFSWWVPWVGAQGSICVAGGLDVNGNVQADSQCYDLATGAFHAPNADLGPLPEPWWGGADAWRTNEAGQYEIWGYNGMDTDTLLQKSFVSTGGGFAYGPAPLHAVFRGEGDNVNGSIWAANGTTDSPGFSATTLQESFQECPACAEQTMHVASIQGRFSLDPYGRTLLRAKVAVHDETHEPLGGVMVDASIWSPAGGPYARTRLTKPATGMAAFPWGSSAAGMWQLCVENLAKTDYTYDPNSNEVPSCATWNN